MAKHEMKAPWDKTGTMISYNPAPDEFYKARINTLEAENAKLRADLEKRAEWYGIGKDAYDQKMQELSKENAKLAEENHNLMIILAKAELRNYGGEA